MTFFKEMQQDMINAGDLPENFAETQDWEEHNEQEKCFDIPEDADFLLLENYILYVINDIPYSTL